MPRFSFGGNLKISESIILLLEKSTKLEKSEFLSIFLIFESEFQMALKLWVFKLETQNLGFWLYTYRSPTVLKNIGLTPS